MINTTTRAAQIVESMARAAVNRASGPSVLLGQDKYNGDDGALLVCCAYWNREPHRVELRWSLTPQRGMPANFITEEEALAYVERQG